LQKEFLKFASRSWAQAPSAVIATMLVTSVQARDVSATKKLVHFGALAITPRSPKSSVREALHGLSSLLGTSDKTDKIFVASAVGLFGKDQAIDLLDIDAKFADSTDAIVPMAADEAFREMLKSAGSDHDFTRIVECGSLFDIGGAKLEGLYTDVLKHAKARGLTEERSLLVGAIRLATVDQKIGFDKVVADYGASRGDLDQLVIALMTDTGQVDTVAKSTDQTKGGHNKTGDGAFAGGHDKTGDGYVDQHATG